jgi:hypothetical protein
VSDYTQSTFFAPKDLLATGNPNKIIYGSDVDAELSAISTAIATKADVNGDAIGAGTPCTELSVDNLKLDGNKITSTNTDGDIELEPDGTGSVAITKVDIADGEIDGTPIGANSASTGAFTTLTASGDVNFDSATFFVDASADAVGIGTSLPAAKLNVTGGGVISTLAGWNTLSNTTFHLANPAVRFGIGYDASDKVLLQGFDSANAARDICLQAYGGNVGIGTTSPAEKLTVATARSYNQSADVAISVGGTDNGFVDNGKTSAWRFNVTGNALNGQSLGFEGFVRGGTWTERARIDTDGSLTVAGGNTIFNGPGFFRHVGTYSRTTASAANLFIFTDGQFYRSTSSARYKNSIEDASYGLSDVMSLRPVTYKGNNDGDTVYGGLVAEEVHDAGLSEFVQYDEQGRPDALAYGNMVSLCIKAIQEQQEIINDLRARVSALEA